MWPDSIDRPLRSIARSARIAQQARPVEQFTLMGHEWSEGLDGLFGRRTSVVYIFEEVGGDPQETRREFEAYKLGLGDNPRRIKLPRLNAVASRCMYVGSSSDGVRGRLAQHVLTAPRGTYALQLSLWFKAKVYRIHLRRYDVDRPTLQLIEDATSETLRPAFGKQGGNGRI